MHSTVKLTLVPNVETTIVYFSAALRSDTFFKNTVAFFKLS